MRRLRSILGALLFLVVWAASVEATTYYVDSDAGSDASAGTSTGAPWRTIPGTRNTGDTGYKQAAWGSVTTTAKIQCGDVIYLKGGTTQSSADFAGAVICDSDYYTNSCTNTARITIRVATNAEWPGSTGDFTLSGTSVTPTYARAGSKGFSDRAALFYHAGVPYLSVGGTSTSQRLVLTGSTGRAFTSLCNGCALSYRGLKLSYFEAKSSSAGVDIGGVEGVLVSQGVIHDITGTGGLNLGSNSSQGLGRSVGVEDVVIYATGASPTTNGDDDAFFATDQYSAWYLRCTSRENHARGFNTGALTDADTGTFLYRFRDIISYQNGDICSTGGSNCLGMGWYVSGKAHPPAACDSTGLTINVIEGAQLWRNYDGGFSTYENAEGDYWHLVTWGNSIHRSDVGDFGWDPSGGKWHIYNSIMPKRSYTTTLLAVSDSGNSCGSKSPIVDYNLFRPVSANSETLGFNLTSCSDGASASGTGTYSSPPCYVSSGTHNKVGAGFTLGFTNTTNCDTNSSTFPQATCDLHLTSSSSAIDAGLCMFSAGTTASGTTISSLTANGGYADPRYYFIAPWNAASPDVGMYLDSVGDTLVIGDDTVTVTALTSSSISFTPSISWTAGDCIHLAGFTGSNRTPELGAYGFDSGASTTTTSTSATSTTSTSTTTTSTSTTVATTTTSTTSTSTSTTTSTTVPPSPTALGLILKGGGIH